MASIPTAAAPTAMPIVAPFERPAELLLFPFPFPLPLLAFVSVGVAVDEPFVAVDVDVAVAVELADVVVVTSPFAAFVKSFSLIDIGVFEVSQALDMVLYTAPTSALSFLPRHCAAVMMKPPPLLQRHLFRAAAVSPLHLEDAEAELRQDWAFVG